MAGLNKLNDAKVRAAGFGRHSDGGGLYLRVEKNLARRFVWRGTWSGREIEMGLGPYPDTILATARDLAAQARRDLLAGLDPRVQREKRVAPTRYERVVAFRDVAEEFLALKNPRLSNAKHRQQWQNTLATYAYPVLGQIPINAVQPIDIIRTLQPIWHTKSETARRVLNRIDNVIRHATVSGRRTLANPTTGVVNSLGRKRPIVEHHTSMPWTEVPAFLKQIDGLASAQASRLALEFTILTAARSGEVRLAQ
ncbi:MAG TPA: integrase family protein [Hyphomicrobiaceae bacterium]|nr:integrase family protein [Hyphomicrobiaceae bacterium]